MSKQVTLNFNSNLISDFLKTLKMSLINYETNIMLTWSADYAISGAARATKLIINHAKFYIAVVT